MFRRDVLKYLGLGSLAAPFLTKPELKELKKLFQPVTEPQTIEHDGNTTIVYETGICASDIVAFDKPYNIPRTSLDV